MAHNDETPFDPDETQPVKVHRLTTPPSIVALDADDPRNAGLNDSYADSAVLLHINVDERGRVELVGWDWSTSMVTPGRHAVLVELDPV